MCNVFTVKHGTCSDMRENVSLFTALRYVGGSRGTAPVNLNLGTLWITPRTIWRRERNHLLPLAGFESRIVCV
jgi:hypothetical protein